ncbi:MAG: CARDB domain-containing protein, partial [Bacteroidota bacterium]
GSNADGFTWVLLTNQDELINSDVTADVDASINDIVQMAINQLNANFDPANTFYQRPLSPSFEVNALPKETSATISFEGGDGENRVIIIKEGSPVNVFPADGQLYDIDQDLGDGNIFVFDGDGTSAEIENLNPNTTYHYAIIEYNNRTFGENEIRLYQLGCHPNGSFTTLLLDNDCKCLDPADNFICEDFESFFASEAIGPQSSCWTTFNGELGNPTDGIISETQAFNGTQSLLIDADGPKDVLFNLNDRQRGSYTLSWQMFIADGNKAFFNLLESQAADQGITFSVTFGNTNNTTGNVSSSKTDFSFPVDQWFKVEQAIDLDNNSISLEVNGINVVDNIAYSGSLGAVNFFAQGDDSEFFIDDLQVESIVADEDDGVPNLACVDPGTLTINNNILLIQGLQIINNGEGPAAGSSVGVFLSDNTTFSITDIYLGENFVPGLAPEETVTISIGVDLSQLDLTPGTFFGGLIIDYKNVVDEISEDDNNDCFFTQPTITIEAPIVQDLTFLDTGSVVVVNDSLKVDSLRVGNIGGSPSDPTKVAFFLSENDLITVGDIEIGEVDVEALTEGDSTGVDFELDFADLNNIPDGTYQIGALIDPDEEQSEGGEDNNSIVFAQTITFPILQEINLNCVDQGILNINGLDLEISDLIIENNGAGDAGGFSIGIYASLNDIFSTIDFQVGEIALEGLEGGESDTLTLTVTMDTTGIPDGEYFIGYILDNLDEVTETEESSDNSCFYNDPKLTLPVNGVPNLTCNNSGTLVVDGQMVSLQNIEVINDGTGSAGTSHVGVYLSTNTTISTIDLFIGEIAVKALAPNEVATLSLMVDLDTLPLPAGEYFLGYLLDYKNEVTEFLEIDNDNCFFQTPKVTVDQPEPNLTCVDLGTLTVNANEITIDDFQMTNDGLGAAGGFRVGVYLSDDDSIETTDDLIAQIFIEGLQPQSVATIDFGIDPDGINLPNGTYNLGFIVDNLDDVDETDENDNSCLQTQTTITLPVDGEPNLTCVDGGALSIEDDLLEITDYIITNNGSDVAGANQLGIYFSTNTTFTNFDFLVSAVDIPALAPGESDTIDVTIDLDTLDFDSGEFFVGAIIDWDQEVSESDETDNNDCFFTTPKVSFPLDTEANLTCKDAGNLTITGLYIAINNLEVTNNGNGASTPTQIGVYLSTDLDFQTTDELIGTIDLPALAAGETASFNFGTDVNSNSIPDGSYNVGFIIDYQNLVSETLEIDNRCGFSDPKFKLPQDGKPDLKCYTLGTLDIEGFTLTIDDLAIINDGVGTAGESHLGIYLSTDPTITKADHQIDKLDIPMLHPGQKAHFDWSKDLSYLTEKCGEFYVGIITDVDEELSESHEYNNTCFYGNKFQTNCAKPDYECWSLGNL